MMFACVRIVVTLLAGASVAVATAMAGQPKHDKETCSQFHTEQTKFIQSGILADLARGAEWGKANLSAERLREIELYITLDEQIKFACREATLTPQMLQVEEIAKRLELNPNADPFAPLPPAEGSPGNSGANGAKAQDGIAAPAQKPAAKAKPNPPAAKPQQTESGQPAAAKPPAANPAAKNSSPKVVNDAYKGPPVGSNAQEADRPSRPAAAVR
jgi:hypothetical protein